LVEELPELVHKIHNLSWLLVLVTITPQFLS
jgi:hypothetical protein